MKMNFKTVVLPPLILCLICFCVTGLLALTNELTKDRIIQAQIEKEEQSRSLVMPDATAYEQVDEFTYLAKNGEEDLGYIFVTESKGYAGTVSVMTGISLDENITGIIILQQSETPGLGANCTNEEFTNRFRQEANELTVVKNTPSGNGNIEALTGSTVTTDAVTDAVNEAIELFDILNGGESVG